MSSRTQIVLTCCLEIYAQTAVKEVLTNHPEVEWETFLRLYEEALELTLQLICQVVRHDQGSRNMPLGPHESWDAENFTRALKPDVLSNTTDQSAKAFSSNIYDNRITLVHGFLEDTKSQMMSRFAADFPRIQAIYDKADTLMLK